MAGKVSPGLLTLRWNQEPFQVFWCFFFLGGGGGREGKGRMGAKQLLSPTYFHPCQHTHSAHPLHKFTHSHTSNHTPTYNQKEAENSCRLGQPRTPCSLTMGRSGRCKPQRIIEYMGILEFKV